MPRCAECSEKVDESDGFCRNCGADLSEEDAKVPDLENLSIKEQLQEMDDWDFEHFVADLWSRQGWETEVEQQSVDAGVDVRAEKENPFEQKILIQAKRFGSNSTVSGPNVQQYSALKQQEPDADAAVIVTSGSVSKQAQERAEELNVKLIDGDELASLVEELDAHDLLSEYLPGLSESTSHEEERTEQSEQTDESVSEPFDAQQTTEEKRTVDSSTVESEDTGGIQGSTVDVESDAHSTTEESRRGINDESLDSSIWYYGVLGGVLLWIVTLSVVSLVPENSPLSTLSGLLILIAWIELPVATYYDTEKIQPVAGWPKYRLFYVVGAAVWFINILVGGFYLIRRREEMQSAGQLENERYSQTSSDWK